MDRVLTGVLFTGGTELAVSALTEVRSDASAAATATSTNRCNMNTGS